MSLFCPAQLKSDSVVEPFADHNLLASFGLQLRMLGQLADFVTHEDGKSASILPESALRSLQASSKPLRELLGQEESVSDDYSPRQSEAAAKDVLLARSSERRNPVFAAQGPQEPLASVTEKNDHRSFMTRTQTQSQQLIRLDPHWDMPDADMNALLAQIEETPEHHQVAKASRKARLRNTILMVDKSLSHFLPNLVRPQNPNSSSRVAWDCTCCMVLVIEAVIIPLEMLDPPTGVVLEIFVWIFNAWWTLDLIASFSVDVHLNGKLSGDFRQSAKHYAKTWFIFDFIIVILGWLSMREGAFMRSARFLRLSRGLRFLRVVKLHLIVSRLQARINSTHAMLFIRISKSVLALMLLTHVLACAWYGLGNSSSQGWIEAETLDPSDFWRCYIIAFHWSITQFHGTMELNPSSEAERIYSVIVVFIALLSFSLLLSSVTEAMVELGQHFHQQLKQIETMSTYMAERRISASITIRVKQFFDAQRRFHQKVDSEVEYLQKMPAPLAMDILFESRVPYLSPHPLFAELCQDHARALRHICHSACRQVPIYPDENVFSHGDACKGMIFVESGTLCYMQGQGYAQESALFASHMMWMNNITSRNLRQLVAHDWLCEAALWTIKWRNTGNSAASTAVVIYTIEGDDLANTIGLYEKAFAICCNYAKLFIKQINAANDLKTDLFTPFLDFKEDERGKESFLRILRSFSTLSSQPTELPHRKGNLQSLDSSDELESQSGEVRECLAPEEECLDPIMFENKEESETVMRSTAHGIQTALDVIVASTPDPL